MKREDLHANMHVIQTSSEGKRTYLVLALEEKEFKLLNVETGARATETYEWLHNYEPMIEAT